MTVILDPPSWISARVRVSNLELGFHTYLDAKLPCWHTFLSGEVFSMFAESFASLTFAKVSIFDIIYVNVGDPKTSYMLKATPDRNLCKQGNTKLKEEVRNPPNT